MLSKARYLFSLSKQNVIAKPQFYFASQSDHKGITEKIGDIKEKVVEKAKVAKDYLSEKAHEAKEAFTNKPSD